MNLAFTPYIWPLAIAIIVTVISMVEAIRRRHIAGARSLAALTAALTWWLFAYAFQLMGQDELTIITLSNLTFLGVAFVPVFWVIFTLEYAGYGRWITVRNSIWIALVPILTQIVIWADPALHLFRTDVQLTVVNDALLNLKSTYGPWFWVHTYYSYALIVIGMVMLGRVFARSSGLYRRQAATLLIGAVVAMAANLLSVFIFKSAFILDPTPFSFTITSVTFALGLFRFRLLDVVPLARDAVIEGMHDGVLVLDLENRVVDLNPVAQQSLGRSGQQIIGQPVDVILPEVSDLLDGVADAVEMQLGESLEVESTPQYYESRLNPLYSRQHLLIGRVLVLHNITDRRLVEQEMAHWLAQFQVLPQLAREIAAARELDVLLERVADLVRERFDAYHIGIFLADESGRAATLRAASGEASDTLVSRDERWALAGAGQHETPLIRVIRSGQSYTRVGQGETGAVYGFSPLLSPAGSEVILPLRLGSRAIGGLMVLGVEATPFGETAHAILQTVADQLAVAVENARLLQQMTSAMEELERTSGQYTEEAWRSMASDAAQTVGYRYRRQGAEAIVEATRAADVAEDVVEISEEGGLLEVPIMVRDRAIGKLHLRFPESQVASNAKPLVQEVATRLALTLESARLYQNTQRRAMREQVTREITDNIRAASSVEEAMRRAVREIARVLNASEMVARLGTETVLIAGEEGDVA